MAAAAHDPAFAAKMGIPQSVAKDFNEADAGIIRPKKKKRHRTSELSDAIEAAMAKHG